MRLALAFAVTLASLPPPALANEKPVVLVYELVTGSKGRIPLDTKDDCDTIKSLAMQFLGSAIKVKCEVGK